MVHENLILNSAIKFCCPETMIFRWQNLMAHQFGFIDPPLILLMKHAYEKL